MLSRGPAIVPIAGTSHQIEENAAACDIAISAATQQALAEIFQPDAAAGVRYPDAISRTLGL